MTSDSSRGSMRACSSWRLRSGNSFELLVSCGTMGAARGRSAESIGTRRDERLEVGAGVRAHAVVEWCTRGSIPNCGSWRSRGGTSIELFVSRGTGVLRAGDPPNQYEAAETKGPRLGGTDRLTRWSSGARAGRCERATRGGRGAAVRSSCSFAGRRRHARRSAESIRFSRNRSARGRIGRTGTRGRRMMLARFASSERSLEVAGRHFERAARSCGTAASRAGDPPNQYEPAERLEVGWGRTAHAVVESCSRWSSASCCSRRSRRGTSNELVVSCGAVASGAGDPPNQYEPAETNGSRLERTDGLTRSSNRARAGRHQLAARGGRGAALRSSCSLAELRRCAREIRRINPNRSKRAARDGVGQTGARGR